VAELRTCGVSFQDPGGLAQSVEITASLLFEAAALARKAFRTTEWMDNGGEAAPFWKCYAPVRSAVW
jgi:hypothetical protein